MPSSRVLPEKYYKLEKHFKQYRWAAKATTDDFIISGKGSEGVDGSGMFDWVSFYRFDINGDGQCDWYINAISPVSTGGDRDSINTIYLRTKTGWSRIGAEIPNDKPDELGYGKANQQQDNYLFGEDIALIHNNLTKINYVITAFKSRHVQENTKPGYRIFAWDKKNNSLKLLDKWEYGSTGAEVYAYFKENGAHEPESPNQTQKKSVRRFDPEIEALEIRKSCNAEELQHTSSYETSSVSPYLLKRCKSFRVNP